MSRIGRMPIDIPGGVTVTVDGQSVTVKGPKGELSLAVASPIEVSVEENQVLVTRPDDERASRSLHGLTRTLIANNIVGVTQGYSKGLEVVGTGYRVQAKRHTVRLKSPGDTAPWEGRAYVWRDAYRLCRRLWKRDERKGPRA